MTDPERTARGILAELQEAVAAKEPDTLSGLMADDVVLFGTAHVNLDREQTLAYLARVVAQEGTIRWDWDHVTPLVAEPGLLAFAGVGTVGLDDAQGRPIGAREPIRLSCVAVEEKGRWRLRHFHGSIPEQG